MPHTAISGAPIKLPQHLDLFYGGAWRTGAGQVTDIFSPGSGEQLAQVRFAGLQDVDAVVAAARTGLPDWRATAPADRARALREVAGILREHARELAMLDAADSGNPVSEMLPDAGYAAGSFDYFAGLVTEMKGASVPMGPGRINFSVREPVGVVLRILPFNHPLLFCAGKAAAVLAAGNALIIKPAEQTPLSALRLAELIGHLFPPGVFNVIPAERDVSAAFARHAGVDSVGLIGSIPAGRAILREAAETIKPAILELGGKNALIAYPDADPEVVARAVVSGMNFGWCGQSCSSSSRAFIHRDIYDAVVGRLAGYAGVYKPGLPTDPATNMGAIISRAQLDRMLVYVAGGKEQGARLLCGGKSPDDPVLAGGFFLEPTIFVDVDASMTIAREEIFGPVLSVLPWDDEETLFAAVNGLIYGLTCSIWTNDLHIAHRAADRVEVGYVWINETSRHFAGAPFGGFKQSGLGREESLEELLTFTREKNIHIKINP